MNNINKYGISFILAAIAVLFAGTIGYYLIEDNWSILDALYMTIITITTVGYGEVYSLSPQGRIFTIFIILLGFGIIATAASALAKIVIENELSGVLRRKSMQKRISKLHNHYIICGFGRIGGAIARRLDDSGVKFVIIEINDDLIEIARQRNYPFIQDNADSDASLISAGIKNAAGIVVCTSNEADNLFITLASRELNENIHIIVRSNDMNIEQRILRAGADRVVYPLQLGGEQIADIINHYIGNDKQQELAGFNIEDLLGFTLKKYTLYENSDRTVEYILKKTKAKECVAIEISDGTVIDNPQNNQVVTKNETLLLLTKEAEADFITYDKEHLIEWNDDLSTGIVSIDIEHKQLITVANALAVAIVDGEGKDRVKIVMDKLMDYTANHFNNEEHLFEKYSYPEKEAHQKEHKQLTQKVIKLSRERGLRFAGNIVEFLEAWLFDHILTTDMKYSVFFKSRNIK